VYSSCPSLLIYKCLFLRNHPLALLFTAYPSGEDGDAEHSFRSLGRLERDLVTVQLKEELLQRLERERQERLQYLSRGRRFPSKDITNCGLYVQALYRTVVNGR